jgi:hypothetical protein
MSTSSVPRLAHFETHLVNFEALVSSNQNTFCTLVQAVARMRPVSASVSDRAKHDQRYFANPEQASTASPLFDLSFVCVLMECVFCTLREAVQGNVSIGAMDT